MNVVRIALVVVLATLVGNVCRAQRYTRVWACQPTSQSAGGAQYDQHPLIKLIRAEQAKYVRESSGQWDYQCFTAADLVRFKRDNVPGQITERLKKDSEFTALIESLRQMTPSDRAKLLRQAKATAKPTWAQLGVISPAGQTDAGQEAEQLIAAAIVNLAVDRLKTL